MGGVVTSHREEGHHQDLLSQRESRRRPAQHDPGHGRPAAGRVGPPRRPGSVLDRRRAGPACLRRDRPVRGAGGGGRRDRASRAGDDDRHRPAAQHGAAGAPGGVGGRAVGWTADARAGRRRAAGRLRDGGGRSGRARGPAVGAAGRPARRRGARRPPRPAAARGRHGRARVRAHGPLRRRLRPQRRPATGLRARGRQRPRGLGRPGPSRTAALVGPGLLRARRRGRGGELPARLLRLHRPVRRAQRCRQPDLGARDPRLRARLRGGRLRRADPLPDGGGPRPARPARRGPVMKVRIVGAGPAGLYLAILLKKADPRHDVAVIERHAPDATFGWGVVFSEETLGSLRDADPETHLRITDTFARWPTVDIRYRGRLLRSRGHAFSAIARKLLLQILQERAREVGVELTFHTEVEELPQGCKYVWFGTDLVLDAFTFIFKETEAGLVQVHAYPFDENTSTWIIECPHATWRALGFDAMDEDESLAACEALFAEELGGHRLLSNRSLWTDFMLVRNESWHHGNVVLLGDAAHTAHFSIGSGTKLAMEDAIALAQAFQRHPRDLERALVDYELERQPVVERFQQAAGDSAAYFTRVSRYAHMDPMPFAFNLLTRSGRVTHANLAQRDPQFVRVLDAWFHVGGGLRPGAVAPPPMFAPWNGLRNRVVRATDDPERMPELALSGAGLVLAGPVAVCPEGRITPDTPTRDAPVSVSPQARIMPDTPTLDPDWRLDEVHAAGAQARLLLTHARRRGSTPRRVHGADVPPREGGWPLLA